MINLAAAQQTGVSTADFVGVEVTRLIPAISQNEYRKSVPSHRHLISVFVKLRAMSRRDPLSLRHSEWGARPSRLPFSASRRKPVFQTEWFHQWFGRNARTCTRDARTPTPSSIQKKSGKEL